MFCCVSHVGWGLAMETRLTVLLSQLPSSAGITSVHYSTMGLMLTLTEVRCDRVYSPEFECYSESLSRDSSLLNLTGPGVFR